MIVPYFVTVSRSSFRLAPVGGGARIAFSAPGGGEVRSILGTTRGRILFEFVPRSFARAGIPPTGLAVREPDGRVRVVSKQGGLPRAWAVPDGRFLIIRSGLGSRTGQALEISSDGTVSVLAERIGGPNESPTVVPIRGGWLYSPLAGVPFVALRKGRPPRRLALLPPAGVSADGRWGAFVTGDTLSLARMDPSERGLGRGAVAARVTLGGELESVGFLGDVAGIKWRSSAYGSWHLVVDLTRRRVAYASTKKAITLSWMRRGDAYVGLGFEDGRLGPLLRIALPSRPASLLPIDLPSNPPIARPAPIAGSTDVIFMF